MKRLWIAALLLAVLFGATLCNNLYLRGFTGALNALLEQAEARAAVSYTHLTLPTIRLV